MKIFIGGGKKKHNDRFTKRFPKQEFEFAAEEESELRWLNKAQRCTHHVVLQHRTTHGHIQKLHGAQIKPYFTDSMPHAYRMIEELIAHGKTLHSNSHTRRGQSPSVSPAASHE